MYAILFSPRFSPIVFCHYNNYLEDYLSNSKALRLIYADDLQIYVQVTANQIETGINLLSKLVWIVMAWVKHNYLTLNPKKRQKR